DYNLQRNLTNGSTESESPRQAWRHLVRTFQGLLSVWTPVVRSASINYWLGLAWCRALLSLDFGDPNQGNEWVRASPLTTRTMRAHRQLLSANRRNVGVIPRCLEGAVPATPRKGRRAGAVLSRLFAGPAGAATGTSLRFHLRAFQSLT